MRENSDVLRIDGEGDVGICVGHVGDPVWEDVEHVHCGSSESDGYRCRGTGRIVRPVVPGLVMDLAEIQCRRLDMAGWAVLS